ncbi:MAG TPA: carboxylesterase [Spongiibacteraceae bacterium]|nr:carboxylesterase [Spongiibacteraceae bacterium]HCS28902.1 carboxylesterase [Spongiibacteraceae bacterium]
MTHLACVEIEPQTPATASVIWLHGLGADGHDFEPIVPELRLPPELAVRFIFPHAPSIPVTINGGMVMPAWFDIRGMDLDTAVDEQDILDSAAATRALIEREVERGIQTERIVLAGFSQGGAVVLNTALSHPEKLAGLLVLSSFFAAQGALTTHPANRDIPIQVFHGTQDPMAPEVLGQQTVAALKELGYQPAYKTYPMPHAVCPEEIADISSWLQSILKH